MVTKTDNHDPAAKLELRRWFLREYHAVGPLDVLDCCQGSGHLWGQLRQEFQVDRYWGLDTKPKQGRLKLDSMRVLAQPGWTQNVIDIDTYGSPWKHWLALLPNLTQPTTVFLTIGQLRIGGGQVDRIALESVGIGGLKLPQSLGTKLHDFAVRYCLTRCYDYGLITVSAMESVSDGNARYVGIRLEKRD